MKSKPVLVDVQEAATANAEEQLETKDGADPAEAADDAWLASIRLRQDYAETVGVEKVLLTVPFRKPNKDEFFRVHPSPKHRLDVTLVEFKTERELFVVLEAVEPALIELATPARSVPVRQSARNDVHLAGEVAGGRSPPRCVAATRRSRRPDSRRSTGSGCTLT